MKRSHCIPRAAKISTLLLVFIAPLTAYSQALWLPSAGPVNRSMGGASTAAPIDATGALYWNPATISALPKSELAFGMELLLADIETASGLPPGVVGPMALAGKTDAEPGVVPLPSVGWVHHQEDSNVTFGMGMFPVAGFRTNFPSDPSNPVFSSLLGNGRVMTEAEFLMIAPAMSIAVSDRLSIGFGPTITMGRIVADPFVFAPANANGAFSSGRGNRYHWGGGAQAGMYYIGDCGWHFGASIKSPQWFERFRFHGEDAMGNPRVVSLRLSLPMIVSMGFAYSGKEDFVFAADVRYFNYNSTDLLGTRGFVNADRSITGLDWGDIFSVALGAQYRKDEVTYLRCGYQYNPSPISNRDMAFNAVTPLIHQHVISLGMSRDLNDCVSMNMAYSYIVDGAKEGQILLPGNVPIPGSSVRTEVSAHVLSMGATVRY